MQFHRFVPILFWLCSLCGCVSISPRESSPVQEVHTAQEHSQLDSVSVVLPQVRTLFLRATPRTEWPEHIEVFFAQADNRLKATDAMKRIEPGHVDRCALAYCLAMIGIQTDENVAVMTEAVQRWKDGFVAETYEEDAISPIPEALFTVWRERKSQAALEALVSLSLDGGPAETLSMVRLGLLREYGNDLMWAIFEITSGDLAKSTQPGSISCLQDLRFRISDRFTYPDDYQAELQALSELRKNAANHHTEYDRFVLKCVAYVLRPWPDNYSR